MVVEKKGDQGHTVKISPGYEKKRKIRLYMVHTSLKTDKHLCLLEPLLKFNGCCMAASEYIFSSFSTVF